MIFISILQIGCEKLGFGVFWNSKWLSQEKKKKEKKKKEEEEEEEEEKDTIG